MGKLALLAVSLLLVAGLVAGISPSSDGTTTSTPYKSTSTPSKSTPAPSTSTAAPSTSTAAPKSTSTPSKSTPAPSTSTPAPSTSTAAPSTSTAAPSTSTPASNTSTTEPTISTTMSSTSTAMSSTRPITPTSFPEETYNFNVTENDTICIMFKGSINFAINYTVSSDKDKTEYAIANVNITEQSSQDYIVTGSCDIDDQYMKIQWGLKDNESSVTLKFTSDNKTWSLDTVEASIFMDPELFKNAIDANETLEIVADFTFDPSSVAVNKSYTCDASLTTNNVNGTINGDKYNNPLTSNMKSIQLQAYNLIADTTDFVDATSCPNKPHVSNTVPIIVGCILGGMVVVVLIAFLVGKRKKNNSNESTA